MAKITYVHPFLSMAVICSYYQHLEILEKSTKELERMRVNFPLLGSHIYNYFGYIRHCMRGKRRDYEKKYLGTR